MPYLNQVTLMGHLTSDPELKESDGQTPVAEFSIALNAKGQAGTRADFFDAVAFGGWAQNLCRSARKGSLVLVEGHLAQDRWVDKRSNQNRSRVRLKAQRVFHLEAKYAEAPEEVAP